MDETKVMQQFLISVHMGTATIRELEKQTQNADTKRLWNELQDSFSQHEQQIQKTMRQLGVEPKNTLGCREKMAVCMEKMKAKNKNDFTLILMGMDAIEMGIRGALQFLYDHDGMNPIFLHEAVEVIEDYDNLLTKLKDHAQDYLHIEQWKQKKNFENMEG